MSTTDIQNFKVTEYIGILTSSSVRGSGITRDMFAKVADFMGSSAKGYEKDLEKTQFQALQELVKLASEKNADAVIGIKICISTVPMERGGLFLVSAIGTAVKGHLRGDS